MIFIAQNVGEDRKFAAFLDQTHRDTGDMRFEGHAGIH
jgi:hypothetical protein